MPENIDDVSAQSITLSTLLGGDHRFEVPDYQRQYSWEKEQLESLWNDIDNIEQEDETHFLGSILLIKRDTGFGERDVYEIVDGQQRLATVSILLAVIKKRLEAEQEIKKSNAIDKYLNDEDSAGEKRQNIELNSLDNEDFAEIIQGNPPSNKESKLWQAAQFFVGKLEKTSIETVEEIRDKVLDSMPVVLIETYDEDSAFLLFETLNERGMELSNIDLMKNKLLKTADEHDLDYDTIKQSWENTVSELRYSIDKPERFFRHYLMYSPKLAINDSISRHTVLDHFKNVMENTDDYEISSIEAFADDIYEKAELYKNIVNSRITRFSDDANTVINNKISQLNDFGAVQERTIILFLISELENESEVIRGLSLIESYDVRTVMASNITGSTINQFYSTTCSDLSRSDNPIDKLHQSLKTRAPTDQEFKTAMRQADLTRSDRTRYILEKYEQDYFNGVKNQAGEIEHVAPRSSFNADKYSSWMTTLDAGKEEFEEYKDKIGNLAIMEKRLNIEAGNSPFEEKKTEYRQSEFEMAKELANYPEWTIEQIEKRTRRLSEEAPIIWNF